MRTHAILLVVFLVLSLTACSTVSAIPASGSSSVPVLCQGPLNPTPPAYFTACQAIVTRSAAFASARTSPGGSMTLTADYCGTPATGYALGQRVAPDANGYYTWQWQAPVPLPVQCTSATLTLIETDANGGHVEQNVASYPLLDY